ncbi:glycosyltransferase family 2 protein [Synechocystis sp. LEGE 06083]|uniref:glycosyltransferase family 2 protein n=1 Tax=Synechocystis sp. LEGE 06083 TaxID=915336 RepID=UPI001D1437D1|nr:glycosyltransferase family 2 protein [Synechocystis sp. LEGE 06083]
MVVADGPRNEAEAVLCQQAREVTEQIDWECEVLRNYSDVNLGCRQRVSSGLDWAFEQVEEAIILEDDCLPHPDFFRYCQELLAYYREDERVWCISGDNFQDGQCRGDGSYYFSNYNHCWGWATWRRCWRKYDHRMINWPAFKQNDYLKTILDNTLEVKYWQDIFDHLYETGKPNTWDYPWTFTCWQNGGLTALPNVNLISNIGFRADGTHTLGESKFANLPVQDLDEIRHPSFLVRDQTADEYTFDDHFGGKAIREAKTFSGKLRSKISTTKRRVKRLLTDPVGLFSAFRRKILERVTV